MPNIKKFVSAIALSTALTGGIVGLGATATVNSASATTSASSAAATTNCFGGCCFRRCCGPNGHRVHRTTIKIFHHIPEVRWRNVRGCKKFFH